MRKQFPFRRLLLSCIAVLLAASAFGQVAYTNQGTNFWFGFVGTYDNTSTDHVVYITSLTTTTGTVSVGVPAVYSTTFTVTAGDTIRKLIPSTYVTPVMSSADFGAPVNMAVNVVANKNVAVFADIEFALRSENTCIYPVANLGNTYYVMDYTPATSSFAAFSEFLIVAQSCEDIVQITPSQNITQGGSHSAGVPYTVTLEPGQMYAVQCANDLTGSMVQSLNHAETGVFAGTSFTKIVNGISSCSNTTGNPLYEQMFPVNTWGQNYVFLPTDTAEDQCRILSETAGTVVTITTSTGATSHHTLNAGQFFDTTVNYTYPIFINGSNPISVGRFMITGNCNKYYNGSSGYGDPAQVVVDPVEQMNLDSISFFVSRTPWLGSSWDIDSTYLQVVTRTADRNTVYLDGANIGTFFRVLAANPLYAYASLTVMPGSHKLITNGHGFLAYSEGLGSAEAESFDAGAYLDELDLTTSFMNPSSCAASDGTATVNPSGIPGFNYHWSNGQTTQTAVGLSAGIYTVIVRDSDCVVHQAKAIISISGEAGYTATVSDTNPTCMAGGKVVAHVLGGHPPYTYSWTPTGQTNAEATGLSAANYTCTITDNNGCKAFVVDTIGDYISPSIGFSPYNDSVCPGNNTQMHAYGLSGGTYTWTPANSGLSCYTCPSPIASPTATVTYTVAGVDVNGCSASGTALLTVVSGPIVSVTGHDSICQGYFDTLTATGGGTYSWNTGGTNDTIIVTSTSSTSQVFTVDVTNGTGPCATVTGSFTVTTVTSTTATVTPPSGSVCSGDSIKLTGGGGSQYTWTPGGETTQSIWAHPTNPTTYTLQVALAGGGCSSTVTDDISISPSPTVTIPPPAPSCAGSPVTLRANVAGTGPFTYKWSPGNATSPSITIMPQSDTIYTVTVSNGCKAVKTVNVNVDANPIINVCCDKVIIMGDDTVLTASGAKTYTWAPDSGLNRDTGAMVIAKPAVTTTYTVTGKDALGCTGTSQVIIVVDLACANFIVPNVFTPNYAGTTGGHDNVLYIPTSNLDGWSMQIYDRWGKEIFSSTSATDYWAGLTESGAKASDGVYYYMISATCQGTTYKKDGFVQLIR